jgi:hypothetical protein
MDVQVQGRVEMSYYTGDQISRPPCCSNPFQDSGGYCHYRVEGLQEAVRLWKR